MKRTFILLAASAMLLAACNKEESGNGYTIQGDKITFGVGVDSIQGEGKPTYRYEYGGVWFRDGDSMFVNGAAYGITPIASSSYPDSNYVRSPLASVTANLSASGAYDFVYPASQFSVGANGQYNATFKKWIEAPNYYSNSCNIGLPDYYDNDANCLWPMYAGIANLANFRGNLRMLNACAFLSPRILYGPEWANVVLSPLSGVTYGADASGNYTACPTIRSFGLDGVIFSNQKLWGATHLDYSNPLNPVMVMDEAVDATSGRDTMVFSGTASNYINENTATQGGGNAGMTNILGIIPIAPAERNDEKTFRVAVMLWIDDFPFNYQGTTVRQPLYLLFLSNESSTTSQIKRNNQYMLDINMQTASNYQYMHGTAENYAAAVINGADSGMRFSNGTLYVSLYPDFLETFFYGCASGL